MATKTHILTINNTLPDSITGDIKVSTIEFANVKDYGALGDGTTDNTTAFNNAVATGKNVYIPEGTFLITGNVVMQADQGLFGNGNKSIIKITNNGYNIWAGQGGWIDSIKFLGDGRDTGKVFQTAIFVYRCSSINITRCTFEAIGGYGVYLHETIAGIKGRAGVTISNCFAYICNISYFMSNEIGEYNRLVDCVSTGHLYGVKMSTGNNQIIGCNISDGYRGLDIGTSSNAGHTSIVNSKFNHNNNANLYVAGEQNGLTFVGCDFQLGNIELHNTNSIIFTGCNFYTEALVLDTSTNIYFTSSNKRYDTVIINTGSSTYFEKGVLNIYNNTFTSF